MDSKLVAKFNKTQTEIAKVEAQVLQATADLQRKLTTLREQDMKVREAIKESMEKHNVKKFEGKDLTITYIAPSVRNGFDGAKFKEDHPDMYEEYKKATPIKASIRIKTK